MTCPEEVVFDRIYGESVVNEGEDAKPIIKIGRTKQWPEFHFFIGVLDGLGGSGSQKYQVNGHLMSGARIASETCADVIRGQLFVPSKCNIWNAASDVIAKYVQDELSNSLMYKIKDLNWLNGCSKLKTRLQKNLPTTIAAAHYSDRTRMITFLWAGNSRIYHFDIKKKTVNFISLDDVKGYEESADGVIYNYMRTHDDNPLSNCISASEPFHLNANSAKLSDFNKGDVIMCCTDGVYSAFKNHEDFENFLFDSCFVRDSKWSLDFQKLDSHVERNCSDDYSLAATQFGMS